jgi:hypothetical protein
MLIIGLQGGISGKSLRRANRVMYRGTMRASSPTELAGVLQSALYLVTLLPRFPACFRLWAKEKSEPHGPPSKGYLLLDSAALAVTANALEMNAAINQSVQGVIAADADALTRMDVGAALTDQDVAGQNKLTVAALDAEALGLGITTVLGRTYAFFMCHCDLPP